MTTPKRRGITITEILVMVAIVFILTVLLVPVFLQANRTSTLPKVETTVGNQYYIDTVTHDNHEYIIFQWSERFGVTHSPTCPCKQTAEQPVPQHSRY